MITRLGVACLLSLSTAILWFTKITPDPPRVYFPYAKFMVPGSDPAQHELMPIRSKWRCLDEKNEWNDCQVSGDVLIVDIGGNQFTWASPPPDAVKQWAE